ncbi:unnamed protein product [Pocillopora meandrina]|uniref:Ig-like domain-containing protein n=1 Tax=Pocillopora meandrina TaxID=46732 RepID=A0AAU9XYG6_9CNID|nr:unnamed protein product [Pocillopora meandrina]
MFSGIFNVSIFSCLVLFIRKAQLAPTFTGTPPNPFYVLEGNNITFVWRYNLSGTFNGVIFRFVSSSPSRTIVDVIVVEGDPSVILEYIGDSVQSCQFVFNSLTDPPEFNNVSSDAVVVEGDPSITLECIADGEPAPNITWTKCCTGTWELGTGNQFVLKTKRNNSGTYRCTTYNGIGTASNRTVKVEVNYQPENLKFMVNDSAVCKGDVISITCSADGKPAVHTYQMFENEILVNDGKSSAAVWIRKYLKEVDFSYKCVANNTVGTAEKTVNVTVKGPSKVYPLENITVIEDENRTLTCNVSGGPVLTVAWTEVSSPSQSSGVMRYLTNISRYNAGEYKCEAANDCGNSSASTFLIVLYKPENVQLMSSAMDDKACTGEVISFNCSANANPGVASYQLFLFENETSILNTSVSGMWSKTLESKGVFVYKCAANNLSL